MLRDISVPVRVGTPEFPGDTPYSCRWTAQLAAGASVNLSAITMSPHVGTHADAPLHVKDGAPGSVELPLAPFIGRCVVVSVDPDDPAITMERIEARAARRRIERLLLRTGRSIASGSFPESWPALTDECIAELLGRGLKLVGVDTPSVDLRESKDLRVHHLLFDGGAFVLENLDLSEISDGEYELIALPVRLDGLDAAPVRAVLGAL
jgi:arylformamidase